MLWIRFLVVLVFIGLSVFSFDELECLRSSCHSRWRKHFSLPKELLYKLYSTNPAFHCSSEGFLKFRDFIANWCQNYKCSNNVEVSHSSINSVCGVSGLKHLISEALEGP